MGWHRRALESSDAKASELSPLWTRLTSLSSDQYPVTKSASYREPERNEKRRGSPAG